MPVTLSDDTATLMIEVFHILAVNHTIELHELSAKVDQMSGDITTQYNQEMATLQADVTAQTTEVASVRTFLNGLGQQLQAALAQARNAGATPQMLAAVQAVHQSLTANTQGLVEAVATNTPSAGQTATDTTGSGLSSTGADTTTGGASTGADTTTGGASAGQTTTGGASTGA